MDNRDILKFDELTVVEQEIVKGAKGWDGKQYHDNGIVIEMVDGEVAGYVVLEKGEQVEETVEATPAEVAPEVAPETPADVATTPDETVPGTGAEMGEPTLEGSAPAEVNQNAMVDNQTSETDAATTAPTE